MVTALYVIMAPMYTIDGTLNKGQWITQTAKKELAL